MALLDAPAFNESKAKMKRNLFIGAIVLVFVLILLTLGGYIAGHGWFFTNLPAEHRVNTFFNALQAKDYNKAFGIWNADPDWQQHPDKYKDYTIKRFTEDWTTESPIKEPITEHHVDISRTDGEGDSSGTIVAVRIPKCKTLFMWVLKKDGSMTWPAGHEILYEAPCIK